MGGIAQLHRYGEIQARRTAPKAQNLHPLLPAMTCTMNRVVGSLAPPGIYFKLEILCRGSLSRHGVRALRAEIARHGVTCARPADRFFEHEVEDNEMNLRDKAA